MSDKSKGKLSLVALILMIFTSVYGFNNIPRAFYMMGYGAIPWYIVGGIFFFLPFAFMVTELGSAFKEEKGGIYSWMEKSVGPTFAFVGTLMWYASYMIWMFMVSSGFMVPLTNFIFGNSLHVPNTYWLSFLAIVWMILVTFGVRFGMNTIKKVTNVGGIAVLSLNALLLVGALLVLALNGHPQTPISLSALTSSPAPGFDNTSIIGFISFMVFALFAYGGVEAVGGLVDETDKPEKNFPRGVIMAALIIAVGYSLMIFFVGFFLNFQTGGEFYQGVKAGTINFGNASYVTMQYLGQELGLAFHMSNSGATMLGGIIARYMGLAILLSLLGAFFTLVYSPVKQIISGTPDKVWPGKIGHIDEKTGMPYSAMNVQLGIVIGFILLNTLFSYINKGVQATFFNVITYMANVSMTIPYMFIIIAFIKFKYNDQIEKPFTIYKSKGLAAFATIVSLAVVGFANIFTIIQPIAQQGSASGNPIVAVVSMIAGPVLFALVAILLMQRYKTKYPDEYAGLKKLNEDEIHHE